MIELHFGTESEHQAMALTAALRGRWPGVAVEPCRDGCAPAAVAGRDADWDDLRVVLFGTGPLPAATLAAVTTELDRAARQRVPPRLLPVATDPARPVPPAPLDGLKALNCRAADESELGRIGTRVGALLGLWTRGSDKPIFVSYRAADGTALAEQVTAFLQEHGYTAWRDEEWLQGGEAVQEEIERRLARAGLVLLLDSPRASESTWIKAEIEWAVRGLVPILPVRLLKPGDRRQVPRFRKLQELGRWYRVETAFDAQGRCVDLSDDGLAGLLGELEDYLSGIFRTGLKLPRYAGEMFARAGFAWSPLVPERGLFEASRPDAHAAMIRMLTHCSPLPTCSRGSAEALKSYAGVAGAALSPLRYNFRLCLHDESLPPPELETLAEELGMQTDAQLRLLDLARLDAFLGSFGGLSTGGGSR
jgi:hypothetical protein